MTSKQVRRLAALLPGGVPRWVRCYDNGGETFDRYTVVFTGNYTRRTRGEHWYLGMSEHPFHPQGFGQHGGSRGACDTVNGWPPAMGRKHPSLGKRIPFVDLPFDCQRAVMQDYRDLWDLPVSGDHS